LLPAKFNSGHRDAARDTIYNDIEPTLYIRSYSRSGHEMSAIISVINGRTTAFSDITALPARDVRMHLRNEQDDASPAREKERVQDWISGRRGGTACNVLARSTEAAADQLLQQASWREIKRVL